MPFTTHPTLPSRPAPSLPPAKMWSSPSRTLMSSSLPRTAKASTQTHQKNWQKSSCGLLQSSQQQLLLTTTLNKNTSSTPRDVLAQCFGLYTMEELPSQLLTMEDLEEGEILPTVKCKQSLKLQKQLLSFNQLAMDVRGTPDSTTG